MDQFMNMQSESGLLLKASTILAVMDFYFSLTKYWLAGFLTSGSVILGLFLLGYLMRGNDHENTEHPYDPSNRPIIFRLLVDLSFVLMSMSSFLVIVTVMIIKTFEDLKAKSGGQIPVDFSLDDLFSTRSPRVQGQVQDAMDHSGFFGVIAGMLVTFLQCLLLISFIRFILVLSKLLQNSIALILTKYA